MTTAVQVEARVLGQRSKNIESRSLTLDDLPAQPTLRQLIEVVVRSEVAAFRERATERQLVSFLTAREIADGVEAGKVATGAFDDTPTNVDADDAVATALLAHTDGLFQVVINAQPVDALDDVVAVTDGSSLLFLRLVALSGG